MGLANFKTKGKVKKPVKRKAVSKYAGVAAAEAQEPFLPVGRHQVRVIQTYEKVSEKSNALHFHAKVEIIATLTEGVELGNYKWLQGVDGKWARGGPGRVKAFVIAADGHASEADFEEKFGDEWPVFIDACTGDEDGEGEYGENPLEGKVLLVTVTGTGKFSENEDGTQGDEYTNCAWAPDDSDD
jgi:hypothetical protein